MSWESYGEGESKAEIEERIQREIAKREARGEPFKQVEVESRSGMPARSFWGKAWCENLESYEDYEGRLNRGRSYLRKGNVYNLTIEEGEIFAYVTGAEIYDVLIKVEPLERDKWDSVKKELSGKVENLVDLLAGKLGDGVMETVTDREAGLFPSPQEISLSCTCPDWADLCKHQAAVMYGIGVMFDESPELLFKLRGVDHSELVRAALDSAKNIGDLVEDKPAGILQAGELSELFGIEITDPESAF